jgi:hypothetical protein
MGAGCTGIRCNDRLSPPDISGSSAILSTVVAFSVGIKLDGVRLILKALHSENFAGYLGRN